MLLPSKFDVAKERAILEALKPIAVQLGKEHEYDDFARRHDIWLKFLELKEYDVEKEYEEVIARFPSWTRDSYLSLGRLYEVAYQNGKSKSNQG